MKFASERLGGGVAHGKDVDDEVLEELRTGLFLVDGHGGLAGGDDLVQLEPFGNQLAAGVAKESTLKAGFGGDEEGSALRGEGVGLVGVLGEEVEADEGVHDGGEAADEGAGGLGYRRDGHGLLVEDIEDAVADGCFKHKGRNVAPGELHD